MDWSDVFGYWQHTNRGDRRALAVYERHYSAYQYRDGRKRTQWGINGEELSLMTPACDAIFSWSRQQVRDDDQTGVQYRVFRNEGPHRSSLLLREAMRYACGRWGPERLFTFINPDKIKSANPGYVFKVVGWTQLERRSGSRLIILEFTDWTWFWITETLLVLERSVIAV